jgi:hypothetical protein
LKDQFDSLTGVAALVPSFPAASTLLAFSVTWLFGYFRESTVAA